MKYIRFFILALLLVLPSCQSKWPVFAEIEFETGSHTETSSPPQTETDTDTEANTDANTETDAETTPPEPRKRVAITFDDGPAFDNDTVQRLTYKIVDEFQKYGGAATFFVVGNRVNAVTGKAIQYAHERGCEFAIHAYTHNIYFDDCNEQDYLNELRQTEAAIQKYIDAEITLLRAPGGHITRERAVLGGYPIINWSVDTEDWRYKARTDQATIEKNVNTIVENALRNVEDGDIILLHEIYQNSFEATCIILERLHQMGFEFVTVTELIGAENLVVGETYYRAP